jgi:subtilisin family serine protease
MVPINQILLPALLLLSIAANAQKKEPVLYLKEGPVKTAYNITETSVEGFNNKALRHKDRTFAVLQFQTLPSAETRNFLAKQGIELLEYIPENAYTVSIAGKLNAGVLKRAGARTLFALSPKHKMHPILSKGDFPHWAKKGGQQVDLWVSFPKPFKATEVIQFLKEAKIDVISTEQQSYRILGVRLVKDRLEEIAAYPFIEYVEPAPPPDKELNENSRNAARAGMLQAPIVNGGRGLNGEGVVIGIGDNGDVQTHMDLSGPRVINEVYSQPISHATHVHATAAGGGIINELYKGYAPKATIISQIFNRIINNAASYVQEYDMVVTNNSYGGWSGCNYYGEYNLVSQIMDQQAFDFPYLQHVFAAGNDGWVSCAPYPPGYHTTFGGYQAAKNVLTVGATTWEGGWGGSSSRGPVQDGRTKPEITAMGDAVYSATLNNGYTYGWGTSFASPAVAGGMALLYQKYRQMYGGQNPKSGLMKALICNGAADIGNHGPDFQYGFGWMHLLRSVEMLEKEQYRIGSITNSATQNHTIEVPANTAQLKVMLYWNDPPGSLLSSHSLVNDLDLSVVSSSEATTFPKKLDTAATDMLNVATTGADHINNMEQVVIDDPAAGTYTLNIAAAVAENPFQEYFLVYDIIPVSITVTNPAGGQGLVPGETVQINWDSYGGPVSTFALEYSTDDGATWTDINSAVDAAARSLWWTVPNIPTSQAIIKIKRNGTTIAHTSDPFTIIGVPLVSLSAVQCEGYISINWMPVTGATDYEVMMVNGNEFIPVVTSTSTSYTYKGLHKDSTYWLSVRARINGKPGRRAVAISRLPKDGTCIGAISNNDLVLDSLISPHTGRKYTSNELSTSALTIRVRNLDDEPVSGFTVKYQLANQAWVSESINATIAAGGTYDHTFSRVEDFTAISNYPLVAVVNNHTTDPITVNDTLFTTIRHLDNQPIDLAAPFLDDIETAAVGTYVGDTMGITGIDRYDFTDTSGLGRLRTYITSKDAFSGTKALIMDAVKYIEGTTPIIAVTGTFNLGEYQAGVNDIRSSFRQKNMTGSTPETKVWVRGNDTQPWREVYDYRTTLTGYNRASPSLEIADTLKKYGQDFSSSFQIKWSFRPRGRAGENMSGFGLFMDDINIYEAIHDMQMLSIDSPVNISCGLSGQVPLKVKIRNSSNSVLLGVPIKYSLNGEAWISETIPSIEANTTLVYNFNTPLNFFASGLYVIKAVVDYPTDNYRANDTLSISVHNAPLVTTFPHLENFEQNDGGWYTLGTNSSWKYGTPASTRINKAASGAKAWKTSLSGNYNDEEYSYLYSPCFQIGGMTHPTLSFSMAMELEDCGSTMCDAAWVEYSIDNINWRRLIDTALAGQNWYSNTVPTYWSNQGYTRWHVATMGLPQNASNIRLRLVMRSDEAINMEGIAIDDIHVYDSAKAIYDGVSPSITATRNVSGSEWVHFESEGKLIASIKPNGQNLGATDVQAFIHSGTVRNANRQYYHNRNITIKPQTTTLSDSVTVRMYFPDSESEALLSATGCSDCAKPASAYELGVSKYSDPDKSKENGDICDDSNVNNWSFIANNKLAVVPFQKGYYIEFKVKDFSEFWLHNGGADLQTPLTSASIPALESVCVNASPVTLSAIPAGGTWSGTGVSGASFNPSVAGPGTHTLAYSFVQSNGCAAVATTSITVNPLPVVTMPSLKAVSIDAAPLALSGALPVGGSWSGEGISNGVFTPAIAGVGTHTLTYAYTDPAGCSSQATTSIIVNPIPVRLLTFILERSGFEDVRAKWTTAEETTILRYELELAKGDEASAAGQFFKIGEVPAKRGNAAVEQYSFVDTEPIKMGRRHYRLKLVANDGSFTYSEVRVIEFPVVTWRIYPNPSAGMFNMNYLIGPSEQMEANVYDARGRLVKQYRKKGSGIMQRLVVDLSPSSFAPGVYMLQTVVSGRKEFYKLHKL